MILLMKTATRIIIIIDMILRCFCIFPVIFGILALKKLSEAQERADVSDGFALCTLLFCSTVGGLFMLTMTDEQYGKKEEPLPEPEPIPEPEPEPIVVLPEDIVLPELIDDIIVREENVKPKFSRKEDIRIYQMRLYKSSADIKRRYALIDSYLYSIAKVRVNYSSKYQTFKAAESGAIAKMAVKNDAVYAYLALDPKKYVGSKYIFKDVSDTSGFAAYPMRVKITTDEQVEDVKELIADLIKERHFAKK